jgi:hypothetical protein
MNRKIGLIVQARNDENNRQVLDQPLALALDRVRQTGKLRVGAELSQDSAIQGSASKNDCAPAGAEQSFDHISDALRSRWQTLTAGQRQELLALIGVGPKC